ncbi:hypothetical protein [Albibacterium bauzanense]|nr:hypothetical protein [Albibacterium bauzanense]
MIELAKSLKENRDFHIRFVTSSEAYIAELIRYNGFDVLLAEYDKLLEVISGQSFELLIIDKLGVESDFIQSIKDKKSNHFKTVIFGNCTSANQLADLVVNAVIGTDFSNKIHTDHSGTKYLTGPKYLTLRKEFAYKAYQHKNILNNILLLFGGSDQANLSCKILEYFRGSSNPYKFTVIIGKGYRFHAELEGITRGNDNIKVLRDIDNVEDVMLENDFLITSPGTTLFEGFYLGIPCIALYQNDSQKEVFRNFYMTFSYEGIDNLENYMNDVYFNIEKYYEELDKLEIGSGKQDIINHISELM